MAEDAQLKEYLLSRNICVSYKPEGHVMFSSFEKIKPRHTQY